MGPVIAEKHGGASANEKSIKEAKDKQANIVTITLHAGINKVCLDFVALSSKLTVTRMR